MTAYVLVQTDTQNGGIASRIREVPGIVFAEDVRGPYDALALVRSGLERGGLPASPRADQAAPGCDPCAGRSDRSAVVRALGAPRRLICPVRREHGRRVR